MMASAPAALRGDYSRIRPDYTVDQPWARYSAAEHDRWRRLYARQMALMPSHAAPEFSHCLARLDAAGGIPDFARVNEELSAATGFRIVAVPGLIPDDVFFDHLAHRRFPVSWWLREERELDYLVEPDVFHDFFGHVPLLMHPVFAGYMEEYGRAGAAAAAAGAVPLLARLYWYTIEFGLIRGADGLRAFGAGILSSHGETRYALESPRPLRLAFSLERVLATGYRIDDYQRCYFVIDSFERLFEETRRPFAPLYAALKDRAPLAPGTLLPGETPLAA
jgi:phenylalanine-4-hydroxylase